MHSSGLKTQSCKKIGYFYLLILFGFFFLLYGESFAFSLKDSRSVKSSEKSFEKDSYIKAFFSFKEEIKKELNGTIPEDYIERIFSSSQISFYPEIMASFFTWKKRVERKEVYKRNFLTPQKIAMAKRFLREHWELLEEIEKRFGVDKEVLVAIFLIETGFGRYTGKWSVFNVLFSQAFAGEYPGFLEYLKEKGISLNNTLVLSRLKTRSAWAKRQLLAFIKLCYQNGWDPFEIKGSIFGAFGYPQFMPLSYFKYGYDWDGDGKVDLFSLGDALASIANYLKNEGWKRDLSFHQKEKVIMKYNFSKAYADTVLEIAQILKKNSLKRNLNLNKTPLNPLPKKNNFSNNTEPPQRG